MRKLFTLLVSSLLVPTFAQQVRVDKTTPYTIRGNIGIEKPVTSGRFAKSFAGLLEANVSFNMRMVDNFGIGVGFQSTNFKANAFLKQKIYNAAIPYQTTLAMNGGFIRFGYDQFLKTNTFLSWALNTGYTFGKFASVNPDTSELNLPIQPITFEAPYIQPEFTANFVMEQRLAFSLLFSYTFVMHNYDARAPRLNHFQEIQEKGDKMIMSYFNFGFGFTVLLGK